MNLAQNLTITPELLSLIAEIDEFKGAWRALKTIAPERLNQLKQVATIESIGSSTRIEGVKLSDKEVEALLSGLDITALQSRDEQEVTGYAAVMEAVFDNYDALTLTENHIQQLHKILLQYSHKDERHRGSYKNHPNHVEAFGTDGTSLGVIFETTSPFDTPQAMQALVAWTVERLENQMLHPLLIIGIFIVRFLAIHPFQDGNGRLSRALTTLLLLQQGYTYVPYASLETIIEANKDQYYLALRRTQTSLKTDTPDWHAWLLFFLRSLKQHKDRLAKKIEQEQALEGTLPELSATIMDLVKDRGRVKISDIETLTNASRGTIKNRLGELVERGLLVRHGKGPATWYAQH